MLAATFLIRFETRSRSAAARPAKRLVEQQHLRLGAERNAEIDQPLPAIGQFAAFDVFDAFEAEEFDQLRGLGVDIGIAVDVAPDVEAHRDFAPAATAADFRRSTGRGTGW